MLFANIVRVNFNYASKRFVRKKRAPMKAWPNDWVPFHWNRPEEKVGYMDNGDLEPFKPPRREKLLIEARNSVELSKLDTNDPIRKLYSLEHAPIKVYRETQNQDVLGDLGLIHELDYPNSLEAKIVRLTHVLRQLQKQIREEGAHNFNGHMRSVANVAAKRRYKHLCELKELHSDRYNRIINSLKIDPPLNKINVPYEKPFRKIQMRRMATEYSRELKEKKVSEFVESLEQEKVNFEQEKQETLKWIEEAKKKIEEMKI